MLTGDENGGEREEFEMTGEEGKQHMSGLISDLAFVSMCVGGEVGTVGFYLT